MLQGQFGLAAVEGLGLGQAALTAFNQLDVGLAAQQVGQLASQLNAAGASANDGHPIANGGQLRLQGFNILQAVEAQGMLFNSWDAKAVGLGAGGDHQLAIAQALTALQHHLAGAWLHRRHPITLPANAMASEEGVVAGSHLPERQFAAEALVKEWQKDEAISRFHQQQGRMSGAPRQLQGGVEAGESATHDHDGRGHRLLGTGARLRGQSRVMRQAI